MHDIRSAIPLTDQTNPAKFPQYEFREYPKMMLDPKGKPFVDGAKKPVIVYDASEEAEFKAKIVSTSVPSSGITSSAIAALASESDEVIKLRAEIAALRAATAEPVEEKRKPGRPAKVALPKDLD